MARPSHTCHHQRGFTLVELIMVIVILGIVGGIVSVFMKGPIDAYLAGGRRAALTDVADTTVRRIARDLHRALPSSIRNPSASCLEFIPTKTGGRYRAEGPGALTFSPTSATSFNMLGDSTHFNGALLPADQTIALNDLIVVYNLGANTGADAYAGNNVATVTSVGAVSAGETPIGITPTQFPVPSTSNRFHVVRSNEQLVSYMCSGTNLFRNVVNVLSTTPTCAAAGSVIATNVNCAGTSFNYGGPDLQRNGLVTMVLSIKDSSANETINLQHEVHVDNMP